MPKKVDVLDVFAPARLSLYDLVGFVKVYMGLLAAGTSEKNIEDSRAYISELALRLGQIKKDLGMSFLTTALHKTAIASGFTDGCQQLSELRSVIDKIRRILLAILKNPAKAKKRAQKIKFFCDELYRKFPFEERFRPGRVAPEIKIPRSSRTNWMADGQPGEAD